MIATTASASVRRLPSGRRRRGRWRSRSAVAVLALAALLGGTAYAAWDTQLLAVKTVEVAGARSVPGSSVLNAARVPVGTPMARLDRAAVRSRVLVALPGVAAVSVERVWPSTVRLVVSERTAAAAVPHAGGYLLVDRTGVAYRPVAAVPAGLAVLQVRSPNPQDEATIAGLAVLRSLPPEVRKLLVRIVAPTAEQVVLVLRDRRLVIWGGANDAAAKGEVVRILLARPGRVIDVSAPGLATVR